MVCGTPEPTPAFASAGGTGPVGLDAEFVFARPWDPQECTRWPLPRKWTQFQANAGAGWSHPMGISLTYPNPVPSPTHTYEYGIRVSSTHHTIAFRLLDKATLDRHRHAAHQPEACHRVGLRRLALPCVRATLGTRMRDGGRTIEPGPPRPDTQRVAAPADTFVASPSDAAAATPLERQSVGVGGSPRYPWRFPPSPWSVGSCCANQWSPTDSNRPDRARRHLHRRQRRATATSASGVERRARNASHGRAQPAQRAPL